MLLALKVLVGFLRGPLTNLGTPPVASDIRSILVRPRFVKDKVCKLLLSTLIIRSVERASSKFVDRLSSRLQQSAGPARLEPSHQAIASSRPRIPHLT